MSRDKKYPLNILLEYKKITVSALACPPRAGMLKLYGRRNKYCCLVFDIFLF